MNAVQPPEPPPAEPVVVHVPVITTEQRLMIDGTYKTITTTDGVESPYITNTYYDISYPATSYSVNNSAFKDSTLYKCFASIVYSDDTTYTKTTEQPKTRIADLKTITNINVPQIKFTSLDGGDVSEIFKTVFPYITFQTATEQRWSDGRIYLK